MSQKILYITDLDGTCIGEEVKLKAAYDELKAEYNCLSS